MNWYLIVNWHRPGYIYIKAKSAHDAMTTLLTAIGSPRKIAANHETIDGSYHEYVLDDADQYQVTEVEPWEMV